VPRVQGLPPAEMRRREDELATLVLARFDDVTERAVEALGATLTAATSAAAASVDDLAVIVSEWTGVVETELVPYVAETYGAGAVTLQLAVADTLPSDVRTAYDVPLVSDQDADAYLAQRRNHLTDVGDDLWVEAREQLREGMAAGESVPELGERVRRAANLTRWRAERVARTEVNGAANAGSYAQALATGIQTLKEWLDTSDGRTRASHVAVGGTRVPLTENFIVGGWAMPRPHDGPAGEVVNCRCTLVFDVAEVCSLLPPRTRVAAATSAKCQSVADTNLTPVDPSGAPPQEYEVIHPGEPVIPAIIYKKHPGETVVAETLDGKTRIRWTGSKYVEDEQVIPGTWDVVEDLTKTKAYALVKGPGWVKPGTAKIKFIEKVVPAPDPPTPAMWTKQDAIAAISHIPNFKRSIVRAHFNSGVYGDKVHWYNPAEKIYDRAVQAQQSYPDLSLLDVLRIMDASLTKTDAPFEKKVLKWLGTKKGKDHAEKAGVKLPTPEAPEVKAPPAATSDADVASHVMDISGLSEMAKDQIFTTFKYSGSKIFYLADDAEDIYGQILGTIEKVGGDHPDLTPLHVLRIIDETTAGKLGVPNAHLWEKKVVDWLKTHEGKRSVTKTTPDFGSKPTKKPVQLVARPSFTDRTQARVDELARQFDPELETYGEIQPDAMLRLQQQMLTDERWDYAGERELISYTGAGYRTLNGALRSKRRISPTLSSRIDAMQRAMRPVPQSFLSHRGTGREQFGVSSLASLKNLVGKTVTDDGFFSTSVGQAAAFSHREVAIQIEVPKGTPAAYVDHISSHQGERELILAAGTRFKVLSVSPPTGHHTSWLVRMRVIIP
jgi:ADP-ribosyltransferase exoenzyme/Phage Mu protein F like protein